MKKPNPTVTLAQISVTRYRLILLLCAGSLVSNSYGFYESWNKQGSFNKDAKLELISEKEFVNQIVILDGKRFVKCTFENVTFKYNGTAPFSLQNDDFSGSRFIASDNPGINASLLLLQGLGYFPKDMRVLVPPGTTVEYPTNMPGEAPQRDPG